MRKFDKRNAKFVPKFAQKKQLLCIKNKGRRSKYKNAGLFTKTEDPNEKYAI